MTSDNRDAVVDRVNDKLEEAAIKMDEVVTELATALGHATIAGIQGGYVQEALEDAVALGRQIQEAKVDPAK